MLLFAILNLSFNQCCYAREECVIDGGRHDFPFRARLQIGLTPFLPTPFGQQRVAPVRGRTHVGIRRSQLRENCDDGRRFRALRFVVGQRAPSLQWQAVTWDNRSDLLAVHYSCGRILVVGVVGAAGLAVCFLFFLGLL